jgi:hypothetical protein
MPSRPRFVARPTSVSHTRPQFGVTDHEGTLRPRGRVLAELATTMRALGDDLDGLAGDGPVTAAAIPVPHEYVRPYDHAAYGLDEGRSGPYEPAERAWDPERDHTPLVRGWLNAFVLAARAGVSVAFERERLDDGWPDVPLVIVPAPLTSTASSLLHVRTSFWGGAAAHAAAGRAAWLSVSADAALPEMAGLAGCHLADRVPPDDRAPCGSSAPGDHSAPATSSTSPTATARWRRAGRDSRSTTARSSPRTPTAGRGWCWRVVAGGSSPRVPPRSSSSWLVAPGAYGPSDRTWGLYAGLLVEAGIREPASVDHPDVTCGSLRGPRGGLVAVTNHGPAAVRVELALPAEARAIRTFGPTGATDLGPERSVDGRLAVELELPAYGATIVGWDDRPWTILAVDGGNSKTDVAIVADDGRLLAAVRGPTASHQQVGMDTGMELLAGLVADARYTGRTRSGAPADVAVYGFAGADTAGDTRGSPRSSTGAASPIVGEVLNDAYPPIRVGTDRGWGVALICGSGVNAPGSRPTAAERGWRR